MAHPITAASPQEPPSALRRAGPAAAAGTPWRPRNAARGGSRRDRPEPGGAVGDATGPAVHPEAVH